MHAATTTQFGSACVTYWASLMTEIPRSLPPDASRFCRPAPAYSDSNVRSASPAAYWAAWADALPVLRLRRREAAACCLAELEAGSASLALCLRAAAAAGAHLTHAGWEGRPEWRAIHDGLRPAQCVLPEPGERRQGWQHHGFRPCSTRLNCCRPLRRPRRLCCVRNLGRALPPGSAPSPARPAQQYRQTACSSLCGGGCACRCPSHKADAGPMDPAAATLSMFTVITMLPARMPACAPGEPSHSDQKAKSFRSDGSFGRLPRVSIRMIAGASTSSRMVPHSSAKRCAAT